MAYIAEPVDEEDHTAPWRFAFMWPLAALEVLHPPSRRLVHPRHYPLCHFSTTARVGQQRYGQRHGPPKGDACSRLVQRDGDALVRNRQVWSRSFFQDHFRQPNLPHRGINRREHQLGHRHSCRSCSRLFWPIQAEARRFLARQHAIKRMCAVLTIQSVSKNIDPLVIFLNQAQSHLLLFWRYTFSLFDDGMPSEI